MYRWNESKTRLHRHAFDLRGAGVAFKVHYWGVSGRLLSNPYHKHSFFEICFVLDGEGTYQDHDAIYPIRKGTLFCSRPGVYHQIVTNGLSLLFVAFELDESASAEAYVEGFRALTRQADIIVEDAEELPAAQLWRSLLIPERGAPVIPETALPYAAHALLLSFPPLFGGAAPEKTGTTSTADTLLNQAKLYIRDNLSEPLSLSAVAASLNISERHLSRLFSSGIHETFTAYLRKERVREAARLLQNSSCSIKEIAERTGFGSVHYFTRTFHSLMTITPARFREQSRLPVR